MLDAGDFAPKGADTLPFGICSDSAVAIKALRDLADAMESGRAVVSQAQSGTTAAADEFVGHRLFLEYHISPFS